MDNLQRINTGQEISPIARGSAFNEYWTYSFINRSTFFALVAPEYYDFMNRFVKQWLWWVDGYVPYFHNADNGIPSTRLAAGLVDKVARKIVGGRLMYRNIGKDKEGDEETPTLSKVAEWANETDFEETVKSAVKFATAAGTALIKLNKGKEGLWSEALRFDSFLPVIDSRGKVIAVDCFLRNFTDLGVQRLTASEGSDVQSFYVLERRRFCDYTMADGTVKKDAAVAEYIIKRSGGQITNGQYVSKSRAGEIKFKDLPKMMQKAIGKAFAGVMFDRPILLPFEGHLGVEIVKFTDTVSGLPELPFGDSLVANIISKLMEWDYYSAAASTDMYLGRGRVLIPKQLQGANSGNYNSGLDSFAFTEYQTTDPEGNKPTPLQFQLRAAEWTEIRTRIIQDISIITGLNTSTIASFVADGAAAKTAREISTEENETLSYINDKRALMEKPLNRILRIVARFMGITDTIVVRWSNAFLTNKMMQAELLQLAVAGGFMSKRKAVQEFNVDDDPAEVDEEYNRVMEDQKAGMPSFEGLNYEYTEEPSAETAEQISDGD